ncbi:MAG: phosphotransferase [Alphaproteobacteria bacterium]|nr:phosphotransferase [Alphaproteobacteria bacterium]
MTREEALNNFLKQHNWDQAERIVLAADASARTYDRLIKKSQTAILMNSPLSERPDLFVMIDKLLQKTGVHVPNILAADMENGFLLLEDFGDNTFTRLLNNGTDELDLYRKGIDALIQIQNNVQLPPDGIAEYTAKRLMNGVLFLPNWFGQYAIPGGINDKAKQEFIDIWTPLIQKIMTLPQNIVLLDYHADNLMITPTGDCGILDFQDACIGPVTYDLMSLLEDERRNVPASVRQNLIEHYFAGCPAYDTPAVRETLSLVAMQRHTRVIGIFMRLFLRDKKEKYLKMIPFVWELVERHLDEPVFADYKVWLDRYIPTTARHTVFNPEKKNAD